MGDEPEAVEQWALVNTPLGEEWSGRARYAAAMYFYKRGEMDAETLEVYRLCARLDGQDPLPIIRDRGVGGEWLEGWGSAGRSLTPPHKEEGNLVGPCGKGWRFA